ncbi:GNAT family N-acetyltransferase [Streptomyces sp. NPDC057623]|uniref:GNAT family N-acetyltransferase n=1 Tax=Streptomyces sp. NPDC057623 TaxID=3346187 RepID=UPI0036A27446
MTTPRILLRAAAPSDVEEITDLHTRSRAAYYLAGGIPEAELVSPEARADRRNAWRRALQADDRTVLCAVREGELAGILSMGEPADADMNATTTGQLHQIHVRRDSWSQGIGGLLHAAFVRHLRDASLTNGVLEVWERNTRARAFYARHGWTPDGHRRPGPSGPSGPTDTHYVRLRLDPAPGLGSGPGSLDLT